ncbi:hypothetical protein SKAU_G00175450 [Synaphobranchus kaupii]|uniref:Uncharacterized protein n=1 Tax=Synaphobranchus kaupii TaxID=118154 RepID=A0A9Q1J159_SYNKA|nr:hypothetical protein SKAU_G00175450 [Synaphobranchus kaupii]
MNVLKARITGQNTEGGRVFTGYERRSEVSVASLWLRGLWKKRKQRKREADALSLCSLDINHEVSGMEHGARVIMAVPERRASVNNEGCGSVMWGCPAVSPLSCNICLIHQTPEQPRCGLAVREVLKSRPPVPLRGFLRFGPRGCRCVQGRKPERTPGQEQEPQLGGGEGRGSRDPQGALLFIATQHFMESLHPRTLQGPSFDIHSAQSSLGTGGQVVLTAADLGSASCP